MALPGTTAANALGSQVLRHVRMGYFDFLGDPLRVTDGPYSMTISGSSDTELNSTFDAIDPQFIDISPVAHTKENSNTVTAALSGMINLDSALMTYLGTRSNWVGRQAIIWYTLYDETLAQIGVPWRHYTGRMVNVSYGVDPVGSKVTVSIENYLASISEPSNRTYLIQSEFDSGDISATASIAAANGGSSISGAGGATDYSGGIWNGSGIWLPGERGLNDAN